MFYKLLLRLLLLSKNKERILAVVADSKAPGAVYILDVKRIDPHWLEKLEQRGKDIFGADFSFCSEETEKAS